MKTRRFGLSFYLALIVVVIGGLAARSFYLELGKQKQVSEANHKTLDALQATIKNVERENLAKSRQIKALEKQFMRLAKMQTAGLSGSTETTPAQITSATTTRSADGNTLVASPTADAVITSPFKISGQVIAFENVVNLRVKDGDGRVLAARSLIATGSMGTLSDFSGSIYFTKPRLGRGTVEVFQISAKDGSEQSKVIIPVLFGK